MSLFSLVLIVAYLAFVFWFISRVYMPRYIELSPEAKVNPRYRLARATVFVLHILHTVSFFLVIIWLPLTVFQMMTFYGDADVPHVSIFARLTMDLAQLPGVTASGLQEQFLSAKMEIEVPAPHRLTFFIFAVSHLAKAMIVVYILLQLRNILASTCNGESFSANNGDRLNNVGRLLVFAYLFGPFWNFFLSGSVINTVAFNTDAISMTIATNGSLLGLLVGIGVLVLSGVIREAEKLEQEQRLTV